jgi:sigma-B regulation protein RsbQ
MMDTGNEVFARNNVNVFGTGETPMLFAHGFGCDQNMWRFVTPGFEDRYRIVLLDYVGHGKSDVNAYDPERYADLNGYALDVLDVCHALDLRDVVLVGHSVGAIICMLAAVNESERFRSLIMVSPSPRYIDDEPDYIGGFSRREIEALLEMMETNYVGWASYLAPQVMLNLERPGLTEELKRSFCSTDPEIAKQFARATFLSDKRDDLAELRVPTLVLQCSEDVIAPAEVGRYVAEHVPGSTLRMLSAKGHCPHMSDPFDTIDAMKEFLRQQEKTRGEADSGRAAARS